MSVLFPQRVHCSESGLSSQISKESTVGFLPTCRCPGQLAGLCVHMACAHTCAAQQPPKPERCGLGNLSEGVATPTGLLCLTHGSL